MNKIACFFLFALLLFFSSCENNSTDNSNSGDSNGGGSNGGTPPVVPETYLDLTASTPSAAFTEVEFFKYYNIDLTQRPEFGDNKRMVFNHKIDKIALVLQYGGIGSSESHYINYNFTKSSITLPFYDDPLGRTKLQSIMPVKISMFEEFTYTRTAQNRLKIEFIFEVQPLMNGSMGGVDHQPTFGDGQQFTLDGYYVNGARAAPYQFTYWQDKTFYKTEDLRNSIPQGKDPYFIELSGYGNKKIDVVASNFLPLGEYEAAIDRMTAVYDDLTGQPRNVFYY